MKMHSTFHYIQIKRKFDQIVCIVQPKKVIENMNKSIDFNGNLINKKDQNDVFWNRTKKEEAEFYVISS